MHTGPQGEPLPELQLPSELSPAVLRSQRFKGLMPCYDVIVAGAFAELDAAKALGAQLGEAGVDHYVKQAGALVPPSSRLEAMCSEEPHGACRADLRMVVDIGGSPHLALHLDPALAEASVGGSPTRPVRVDESGTMWAAPLPVKTIADVNVGDSWTLTNAAGGEPVSCTVSGFGAIVQGQPHFGWYSDEGMPTRPGCGSPEPMARLDCEGEVVGSSWVARPADAAAIGTFTEAEAPDPAVEAWLAKAGATARSEAEAHARDQGVPLSEESKITTLTGGTGGPLSGARQHLQTGEGYAHCGGEDVNLSQLAILRDGAPVVALHDTTDRSVMGVIEVDGEILVLESDWTGSRLLVGADGTSNCTLEVAFCDCGC